MHNIAKLAYFRQNDMLYLHAQIITIVKKIFFIVTAPEGAISGRKIFFSIEKKNVFF
jgi:hypothetical protein